MTTRESYHAIGFQAMVTQAIGKKTAFSTYERGFRCRAIVVLSAGIVKCLGVVDPMAQALALACVVPCTSSTHHASNVAAVNRTALEAGASLTPRATRCKHPPENRTLFATRISRLKVTSVGAHGL